MSKFICDSGTMTFAGSTIDSDGTCLNSVGIDVTSDVVSYLCMGDDLWQSNAGGMKSWTCTFETALDSAEGIDISNTIGVTAA